MYKCKSKAYFKFDTILNIVNNLSPYDLICIISDNLLIHTDVSTLKSDLGFMLNLEVQVFEDKPFTLYL